MVWMVPTVPSTPLRALSTVVVRLAFCCPASWAVAPCVTTPTASWAWSGSTEIVALPSAWMAPCEVCASSAPAKSGKQTRSRRNLCMMRVSTFKCSAYVWPAPEFSNARLALHLPDAQINVEAQRQLIQPEADGLAGCGGHRVAQHEFKDMRVGAPQETKRVSIAGAHRTVTGHSRIPLHDEGGARPEAYAGAESNRRLIRARYSQRDGRRGG